MIKKFLNFMNKNKEILIYSVLLMAYGIYMLLRSPLSPGAVTISGADSSVFMYIGQGMTKGLVPYKDLFDHKGMIIYIIEWIGFTIFNGTIGIWIMEIIFLWINFIIVWKIVKLFTKENMIAFFTVIITFLPYIMYYSGGNRVEEWAMTFILLSLYTFIKYLKNRPEISYKNVFFSGMSTAGILWCKPNLIIVCIVYILIILLDLLLRKKYNDVLKCMIYFSLGMGLVSLPIIIYLLANNALKHCFNSYLIFNFKYVGDRGSFASVLEDAINYWSLTVLSSISFMACAVGIIKCNKKSNEFLILMASEIFLVLSFIMVAMSGRGHAFYAIACIPTFVYPTFYAVNYIIKDRKKGIKTFIVSMFIILIIFSNETYELIRLVGNAHNVEKKVKSNEEIIAEYIKETTSEEDEVIVLGNKTQINLLSERNNTAKYFFQEPIADIDENIANEFMRWLKKEKPQVMVCYLKESTKNNSYFREQLFKYLDRVIKSGEYTENKDLVEDIVIYEKVKEN